MSRALFRALALALPLIGLGATWGWIHVHAQKGTEWDVPVEGYDPRDLLRGHYITYRYDWPGLERDDNANGRETLCLEGTPPVIRRAFVTAIGTCRHPLGGTDIWAADQGQLYVPQDKARVLEENLRDPKLQGVVRIRVRSDGHITPLRITFRPRPAEPPAAR